MLHQQLTSARAAIWCRDEMRDAVAKKDWKRQSELGERLRILGHEVKKWEETYSKTYGRKRQ
jgi:hypothetical protein